VAEGAAGRELKVGSGFASGAGLGRLMQQIQVTSEQAAETQAAGSCRNTGMGRAGSCGFMRHIHKVGAENGVGSGLR
jgi:hypothetical protein